MNVLQPVHSVLAFDFGLARIGVAVGNTLLCQAQALEIIDAKEPSVRFGRIAALIGSWQVACLVVGIPRHPDGAPHDMTLRCEKFARQLEGRFDLPVFPVDERYTSVIAHSEQSGKGPQRSRPKRLDHHAAALILEQYFSELPA